MLALTTSSDVYFYTHNLGGTTGVMLLSHVYGAGAFLALWRSF